MTLPKIFKNADYMSAIIIMMGVAFCGMLLMAALSDDEVKAGVAAAQAACEADGGAYVRNSSSTLGFSASAFSCVAPLAPR